MDKKAFWEQILAKLFATANKQHILSFFKDTVVVDVKEGVLTIGVPSIFAKEFVRERYHLKILQFDIHTPKHHFY